MRRTESRIRKLISKNITDFITGLLLTFNFLHWRFRTADKISNGINRLKVIFLLKIRINFFFFWIRFCDGCVGREFGGNFGGSSFVVGIDNAVILVLLGGVEMLV